MKKMLFITVCFFSLMFEVRAYEKSIKNGTVEPIIKGDKREIYVYEQTIVIRDLFTNGKVRRCDMMNTHFGEQLPTFKEIKAFFSPQSVQQTGMSELLKIMASCDAVDEQSSVKFPPSTVKPTDGIFKAGLSSLTNKLEKASKHLSSAFGKVRKNIFPRTKWCGRGNEADTYHDLGELRKADRCCRAHDFCPIKILGNAALYGLKNPKDYTTSHCVCDSEFYNCLKTIDQSSAGQIGWMYFSILKPYCIQGYPANNNGNSGSSDNVMRLAPAEKMWYDQYVALYNDTSIYDINDFAN